MKWAALGAPGTIILVPSRTQPLAVARACVFTLSSSKRPPGSLCARRVMALPSAMPASKASRCASKPGASARSIRRAASTAQPAKGSSAMPRPSSSATKAVSTKLQPRPPSASGIDSDSHPISAYWLQRSRDHPPSIAHLRRASKPYCSRTKREADSRSICCPSVRLKSICFLLPGGRALQAERQLGDDVLLHFLRPAVDGRRSRDQRRGRAPRHEIRPARKLLSVHGLALAVTP